MMSFEPQNKLEHSLLRAAADSAYRPQFYKDFAEADLFIIEEGPVPEKSGAVTLQEDQTLNIRNIEFNGKSCIPVFSSLPRLQSVVQKESRYVAINAIEFIKLIGESELVLNPGSDYGKEFTKSEIASIIDGSIWQPTERYVAKKSEQVLLGQPARHPTELVEALRRYFKSIKAVKRAYLAHFCNTARQEKPHTLIGIEFSGDWDTVIAGAGLVIEGVNVPDPPVDFMPIQGKGGIEDYFKKDCKPFYERKVLGIF